MAPNTIETVTLNTKLALVGQKAPTHRPAQIRPITPIEAQFPARKTHKTASPHSSPPTAPLARPINQVYSN